VAGSFLPLPGGRRASALLSARAEWRFPARLCWRALFLGFALLCLFVGLEEIERRGVRTIFKLGPPRKLFNEVQCQKETNLTQPMWGSRDKSSGQHLRRPS